MTIDRTDPYSRLNPRPVPAEDYTCEETYRHTRAPVDLAVTLIPDAYTSREFFELERKKVFASSCVVVGLASQVQNTGQVIVAEVAGRSIIVTRDKQGQLRAFDMSEVREFDKADYGLLPVRAESWGFLVFVNLDPDASPLTEQIGDLPERFSDYRLEEWREGGEELQGDPGHE